MKRKTAVNGKGREGGRGEGEREGKQKGTQERVGRGSGRRAELQDPARCKVNKRVRGTPRWLRPLQLLFRVLGFLTRSQPMNVKSEEKGIAFPVYSYRWNFTSIPAHILTSPLISCLNLLPISPYRA